jgi:predicted metal-dependent phosphotriesterase family hydrolase
MVGQRVRRRRTVVADVRRVHALTLGAEGLNPNAVCFGHSDETDDVAYLTDLATRG